MASSEDGKSKILRFVSDWGGALALVISIVSSAYTFRAEIQKPRQEHFAQFRSSISAIRTAKRDEQVKLAATNDPMEKINIHNAAKEQKLASVDAAAQALDEIGSATDINPDDLNVLSYEMSGQGRFAEAFKYIQMASDKAPNDPVLQSDVDSWRARVVLTQKGPAGLPEAMQYYEAGDKLLSSYNHPAVPMKRAGFLAEMTLDEAMYGDCLLARQYYTRFKALLVGNVTPDAIILDQAMKQRLSIQTHCPAQAFL